MIRTFVSDFHIKTHDDESYKILLRFLNSDLARKSDEIYFLGDIFDLMAGFHPEYFDWYPDFFKAIKDHLLRGATIHYFEGNHDIHLTKLYSAFSKKNEVPPERLIIHKSPKVFEFESKKVYISHGDEIEIGDAVYKYYKGFISLPLLGWVADHLMPLAFFEYLGRRASKASKKRRSVRFSEAIWAELKEKYRFGVRKLWESYKFDVALCGHTHIEDDYRDEKFRYLNAGYPEHAKKVILCDQGEFFIKLID